jgi:TRAP-type C4-dicarboxylate transport system substrate-binding protein
VAAAVLAVLAAGVAAAAPPPNKSGGTAPVELTLLNTDSDFYGVPAVERFIDRVAELSEGTVTVEVRPVNADSSDFQRRVIREVQANEAQLAWVGTRYWDTLGVTTFRALHAPMLVDSYALEGAVLRSSLPARMLAGLDGSGLVGLALLGDNLRYPASAKRQLSGPDDFRGIRFRTTPSATQVAALRALGAHPSTEGYVRLSRGLRSGRLAGFETDLATYESNGYAGVAPYLTVNLALWPRTTVLFANGGALDALSAEQRGWIRQAAADAARYSLTTFGEDQRIIRSECQNGMKAVVASPTQLAALRKAFAPAYVSLRKDPGTAAMIDEITALKRGVQPESLAIPSGCRAASVRATAG